MDEKEPKTEMSNLDEMADEITKANQNQNGEEVKDEGDKSEGGTHADENTAGGESTGWITSLPKEFREEAKGCDNLSAFLKKLKSDGGQVHETDEDWEKFCTSIGAKENSEERKTVEMLKKAGMSTKSAGSFLSEVNEIALAKQAEGLRAQKERLESYLDAGAKSDKAFMATVKNGMSAYSKSNPKEFLEAREKGYLKDPVFVSALYAIGKGNTEKSFQNSDAHGNREREIDPLNPYGY